MTRTESQPGLATRFGLALVWPRAALELAGDRRNAGRSGSDLLIAMIAIVIATQLRALVEAGWLAVAIDVSLGVRAVVQVLTDALVLDLGFLVIGAAILYVAAGPSEAERAATREAKARRRRHLFALVEQPDTPAPSVFSVSAQQRAVSATTTPSLLPPLR